MKRILGLLAAIVCGVGVVIGIAGCDKQSEDLSGGISIISSSITEGTNESITEETSGGEETTTPNDEHEHVVGDWVIVKDSHWKECQCGRVEEEKHTFGVYFLESEGHYQECICGFRQEESHFLGELIYNETMHWSECVCGYKSETEAHIYGEWYIEEDTHYRLCRDCGYKQELIHSYGNWQKTGNEHYKECICGDKITETHEFLRECMGWNGEAGHYNECVCGEKTIVPHEFVWKVTEQSHRKVCSCGYITEKVTHTYGEYFKDGEKHYRDCICGYRMEEFHSYQIMGGYNIHYYQCYCGEKKEEPHVYEWEITKDEHWKLCTVCNVERFREEHTYNEQDKCIDCGRDFGARSMEYTLHKNNYYILSSVGTSNESEITVPDTYNGLEVKEIGENAFYGCTGLEKISLGDKVKTIGRGAFADCSNLKEINIPNSVEFIGGRVCVGCPNLKKIELEHKIWAVEYYDYIWNSDLEEYEFKSYWGNVTVTDFGTARNLLHGELGHGGDGSAYRVD